MKYTIFSIDNVSDLHSMAKFLRHVDTLRAMSQLRGNMIQCIGSYKGELEVSFMCRSDDFEAYILNSGYVDNQESILRVSECNKQYAELYFLAEQGRVSIGSLKSVDKATAMGHDAWTYRPDLNTYWIAVDGNPDTVNN